jgi:PmbA protein
MTHAYPDRQRLHQIAATGRDLLTRSGVDRWEFYAKASVTREVAIVPGTPPRVTQVEEVGAAVRTVRDHRAGFGAASGLEGDTARRAVEGSLSSEVPTPFDPLPPQRLLGVIEPPPARPASPQGWAVHTADELAAALIRLSDGELVLRRSLVQEGGFSWLLTTAEGFVAAYENTTSSLLAEVRLSEPATGVWRDWFHISDPESFDPEEVASRVVDRALLTRSQVTTDAGLRDVILDAEVTAQLLAALAPLFLATAGERDPLPGLLNADGQLASRALTVVDDRADAAAPIAGPCDGEGLPARRTLLLDEGVPRHRLACYRDAVAYSETPRGGALRLSYRDYPSSGIANLRVVTDEGMAPARLLEAADRALYLLRPLAPIVFDPASDSYRIIASGVWLRGQRVRGWHPVVELEGSISLLLRRVEAVGTDVGWFQTERGCVGAPSLLVRRQPVVG